MDSSLRILRKEAGYRSAGEFATANGISAPSYSRYEQEPKKMPLQVAWRLADSLGCSIDELVGRVAPCREDPRGEVQRFYDSLSAESRRQLDLFIAFVQQQEVSVQQRLQDETDRIYRSYAMSYQRLFFAHIVDKPDLLSTVVFGTDEERRDLFREFVEQHAIARRLGEIEMAYEERVAQNGGDPDGSLRYEVEDEYADRDTAVVDLIMKAYDELD